MIRKFQILPTSQPRLDFNAPFRRGGPGRWSRCPSERGRGTRPDPKLGRRRRYNRRSQHGSMAAIASGRGSCHRLTRDRVGSPVQHHYPLAAGATQCPRGPVVLSEDKLASAGLRSSHSDSTIPSSPLSSKQHPSPPTPPFRAEPTTTHLYTQTW